MAPQEASKLDEVLEQLSGLRDEFRVFLTAMLGSPDQDKEKPSGRIPALERKSANHERRLRRIEGIILMVLGAVGLIKALAWGADKIAHVMQVLR